VTEVVLVVRRALISVADKSGLVEFGRALEQRVVEARYQPVAECDAQQLV